MILAMEAMFFIYVIQLLIVTFQADFTNCRQFFRSQTAIFLPSSNPWNVSRRYQNKNLIKLKNL